MDEATIQKRIEQLNASPNMVAFYRAAYADGLEAAAKIVDGHAGELTREMCDGCGNEDDVATGAMNDQARYIAKQIRQHAKEMGHE